MERSDPSDGPESRDAGQRRRVTLLFSDLCDYTELSEQLDPEHIDQLRSTFEAGATRILESHGGEVSQYYGDGILAVFGLPTASEHDARSAVNAALDLRGLPSRCASALADAQIQLPHAFKLAMHFGVHSGLVFVRRGDALRGRYQLTGDAVNTAARLCSTAARDEILVSEEALRGIEPFFHTAAVRELALKGKRLSVPAYQILAQSRVRTRFEASAQLGLTNLVGRERELSLLRAAIEDAAEGGTTRVVALSGSAGIGKTRAIEELVRHHQTSDVQVVRGTCDRDSSVVPLQPFLSILRQMLSIDDASGRAVDVLRRRCLELGHGLSDHAELLADVLALESGGDCAVIRALERRLVQALQALVAALEARRVVLVIDDFQWVDDLTYRVLRELLTQPIPGLVILLATRELSAEDGLLATAQKIELSPLSLADCAQVIRALAPGVLELGTTEALCRRTGGNPLFLEELCRSLSSGQANPTVNAEKVPNTIHGVIQARLERLPTHELRILRVAAVIGNEFSAGLLAEVAAEQGIESTLECLSAADLIRAIEGGSFRFKHGITREVVYESVRLDERRRLHASVASQFERRAADSGGQAPHEALAHHFVGSRQHARAAQHAELAGDRAAAASALDRARAQYSTALAELDKLPQSDAVKRDWLNVSLKWARATMYCQSPDQLLVLERAEQYAQALAGIDTQSDVAHVAAWICYALGDQDAAIRHCQRGLELADKIGHHKHIGQLTSNLGQCHAAAGQYDLALPLLEHALQLKRLQASKGGRSVPIGFAYALAVSATVHADRGAFPRSEQEMAEALDSVRGRGNAVEASMLALRGMTELWRGDLKGCIATSRRAAITAERVWGPYVYCISEVTSAFSQYVLTRELEQYTRLTRAVDWLESHNMGLYLSMAYGCAAQASLLAGEWQRAQTSAERALMRAEQSDPFGAAVAYRVLAELRATEVGSCDAQVKLWLEQADDAAHVRGSARELALNKLCYAEILMRTGEYASVDRHVRARQELEDLGMLLRADN